MKSGGEGTGRTWNRNERWCRRSWPVLIPVRGFLNSLNWGGKGHPAFWKRHLLGKGRGWRKRSTRAEQQNGCSESWLSALDWMGYGQQFQRSLALTRMDHNSESPNKSFLLYNPLFWVVYNSNRKGNWHSFYLLWYRSSGMLPDKSKGRIILEAFWLGLVFLIRNCIVPLCAFILLK